MNILANTKDKLSEDQLREILLTALKQSTKLQLQIQMWEDLEPDHQRRTHLGLQNIITKRLSDEQMEANHRRGRPANQDSAVPAPKAKGRARDTSNGRNGGSSANGGKDRKGGKGQKGDGKGKTGGSATAGDPGRGKNSTQLCFAFISGNCDKGDACKFVHVSDAQRSGLARALSNSPGAQNRSESNGRDKKGKGKGKGKAQDKGKKGKGKGKAAPAPSEVTKTGSAALNAMTAEEVKAYAAKLESAPQYCGNFAKNKCSLGDKCPWPHHESYSVEAIKAASANRKAIKAAKAVPAETV